jgi:cytoskeletal protein RodZ
MNHYVEIGNYLRMAREERRISLPDAASQLHIRTRYLMAIEEGNLGILPGLPYAKGYLNRYAGFLNLDRMEIMRRFEYAQKEARTPFFFLPQTFSQDKHAVRQLVFLSGLAFAVVFLLWVFWVRPDYSAVSMVDAPVKNTLMQVKMPSLGQKNPCFISQARLYPPCYATQPTQIIPPIPYRSYRRWW